MTPIGPRARKAALVAHVTSSVGWLGAAAGFLALAVAGLRSDDAGVVRASYVAMEPITTFALVPLAFAALVTGLIQSFATPWGLFRHYWVVVKFLLTLFAGAILLLYTHTVSTIGRTAADTTVSGAELRALGMSPVVHATGGLVILLVTTSLSVFKPRGMTRYGHRRQRRSRTASGTADAVPDESGYSRAMLANRV